MKLALLIFAMLCVALGTSSCAYFGPTSTVALGGKGAREQTRPDGSSDRQVWNNEKSFRDGALTVGTLAAGYFWNQSNQAAEVTSRTVSDNATQVELGKQAVEVEQIKANAATEALKLTQ